MTVCKRLLLFAVSLYRIVLSATVLLSAQVNNESQFSPFDVQYRIEIASFSTSARALAVAEKLQSLLAQPVYIVPSNGLWIVHVGAFARPEDARLAVECLKDIGLQSIKIIEIHSKTPSSDRPIQSGSKAYSYSMPIGYTKEEIRLDGILNERAWQTAPIATNFVQSEPFDRAPITEQTEVRILQDDENIYFGFFCYDREPDKIKAYEMRRDAFLMEDDYVSIYLDTYRDFRNFYNFYTNPLGCRRDALITDGMHYNGEWDGIWDVKTSITPEGWIAEFKIPFYTLRFNENGGGIWGINFLRSIRRKRERAYWIPIPRELGRFGSWRASLFGQVEGVHAQYEGLGLEIKPYALGGVTRQYRPLSMDRQSNQGIDLRYNFTPNLRSDFSYNTDFAQVEADQEVVNLTRFSVYFPEKREFFLENAGLFEMAGGGSEFSGGGGGGGGGGGRGMRMTNAEYFYSRRIGIESGQPIPVLGAAKISGRLGNSYTMGMMNIQTEGKNYLNEDEVITWSPATNFSAVRLKKDLFRESSIGGMFLNKQSSDKLYNRLAAVDGLFKAGTVLQIGGNIARTFSPGISKKDYAGAFQMGIQKNSVSWRTSYIQIDPNFNPEMGFVRRYDIKSYRSTLFGTKWINNRIIRDISAYGSGGYMTDSDSEFILNQGGGRLMMAFATGDEIMVRIDREEERITEPFEIRDLDVETGDYTTWNRTVGFFTDESRRMSAGIFYENADYWGGENKGVMIFSGIRPLYNLNLELIYQSERVNHPRARFNTNVLSNRITYAFNPDMFAKTYIQWNELDKRISVNFLFSYQYRDGSNFYLVYNEIYDSEERINIDINNRALLFKFTYLFRI